MTKLHADVAGALVEATQGTRPTPLQAERIASATGAVRDVLSSTAHASLFDTEPSHLQAVLVALAEPQGPRDE